MLQQNHKFTTNTNVHKPFMGCN